jgi:S1-C subfamily serine protease
MAKDRLADKLAVILHADVAGSTQLVQQDKHLAHERIQEAFRRFSDNIEKYTGKVLELRGDALLVEFKIKKVKKDAEAFLAVKRSPPHKWMPIVFAILSVSCASGKDISEKYEAGGQHRAYAIGDKGATGAAWNYPTSEQAIAAALNSCKREGEFGCHVTDLNGKPYNKTSSKKSEEVQLEPAAALESVPVPKPAVALESVPVPKPVSAPEPGPVPILASTGTGFFLSTKGHIITNAHVVDECGFSRILYRNNTYDVSLIKVDQHNDLALLQSTITDHKTAQLEIDRIPLLGEPVIAFAYPLSSVLSSKPKVTEGILSSTTGLNDDSRYFKISTPIQSGNSGGPLLDKFGRVIGVVTAKPNESWSFENTDAIPQNVSFAIKTLVVKAFLDSNSIVMDKPKQAPRQMSQPDIAEAADLYTVQIGCFK